MQFSVCVKGWSSEVTEMDDDTELLRVTKIRVECEELQKILMMLMTGEYNGG